jgi:hypothetical protein
MISSVPSVIEVVWNWIMGHMPYGHFASSHTGILSDLRDPGKLMLETFDFSAAWNQLLRLIIFIFDRSGNKEVENVT